MNCVVINSSNDTYFLAASTSQRLFARWPNGGNMKRIILALAISTFTLGSAMAASCDSMAVDKNGKALGGAAKDSFLKKCKADACAGKAMSKDGKPLAGASKDSFMKKCESEA
jgi:hypothetical protein